MSIPSAQAGQSTACPAVLLGTDNNICTAADVKVAAAIAGLGSETGACMPGEQYVVNLAGNVEMRSNSRWDIGIFVASDGKDLRSLPANGGASICEVVPLPPIPRQRDSSDGTEDPVMGSFDTNGAQDACGDTDGLSNGDIVSNLSLTVENGTYDGPVTLTCVAGPTGKLVLQSLVSWNQQDPGACDPTNPLDYDIQKSKCSTEAGEINVEIVGRVTIRKAAVNGGLNDFAFSYTNDKVPTTDSITNPTSSFTLQDQDEVEIWAEIGTGDATIVVDETILNLPPNWQLDSISCTGDDATPVSIDGSEVTVTLSYDATVLDDSQDDVICTYTNIEVNPEVTLDKTTTTPNYDDTEDSISYAYAVSNTGNVALAFPVLVSDDKVTVDCPVNDGGSPNNGDAILDPGESISCTATYDIDQADIDNGSVMNTADATVDGITSNQDSVTVSAVQSPAMTVVKSSPTTSVTEPGTVSYSYLVSNSGNITLTGISLSDDNDENDMSCPATSLAPDGDMTCTATRIVTQAEINAGGNLSNTVSATSTEGASAQSTLNIPITQTPSLLVLKAGQWNDDGSIAGVAEEGETISYTIGVSNNGNTTLTSISVTDPLITAAPNNGTISCNSGANPIASLDPGENDSCTAIYTITADDVTAGTRANTATATSGGTSDTGSEDVVLPSTAGLSLDKQGTFNDDTVADGYAQMGETISYTFDVSNTGATAVTNIVVTDPLITGAPNNGTISCPGNSLAGGESMQCTAPYTLTQADVDLGLVYNMATADSAETEPTTDENIESLTQNISWTIGKSGVFQDDVTGDRLAQPGETVIYTFAIENNGFVTLTNVLVTDPKVASITCPGGNPIPGIAPAATVNCTGSYTISQVDIDAGQVENTGTGNPDETPSSTGDATTNLPQLAAMTIVKSSATTEVTSPGPVLYSYLVSNTGNVTLNGISLSDDNDDGDLSCPAAALAPGTPMTCTATHTVIQAEIDANGSPIADSGLLENTVTGSATELEESVTAELDITITLTSGMTVQKSSTIDTVTTVMDVPYDYLVSNTGNVTLTGISLVDNNVVGGVNCSGIDELAPGEDMPCTAMHPVTQEELDADGSPDAGSGILYNEVTATSNETEPETDNLSIPIEIVTGTTFAVTKDFPDNNPAQVTVQITCNAGLPLQQQYKISNTKDVSFVVKHFTPGEMDCWIEELHSLAAGYSATFVAGAGDGDAEDIRSEADGCYFDGVVGGEFLCDITNDVDTVAVDVHKVWEIPSAGNDIPQSADITIWCESEIEGGQPDLDSGHFYQEFLGLDGDATAQAMVWPEYPSSNCWAEEAAVARAVEVSNDCGQSLQTAQMTISPGNGDECTITNTVFFEGIPSLDRYGLMVLALLMLGLGAVGIRRFT